VLSSPPRDLAGLRLCSLLIGFRGRSNRSRRAAATSSSEVLDGSDRSSEGGIATAEVTTSALMGQWASARKATSANEWSFSHSRQRTLKGGRR
ncbi:hypothetical protein M514_22527, partial [Trichuris suis]